MSKGASAARPPRTPAEFVEQCGKIARDSGRGSLGKSPVVFRLRHDGEEKQCTVDVVRQGGEKHVKVELMSFDPDKELGKILNDPGEFACDEVVKAMQKVPQGLDLFFMYKGSPYEIEDMAAEPGKPITCDLVPWGSLDESARPYAEIRRWAEWCRDPVLPWIV